MYKLPELRDSMYPEFDNILKYIYRANSDNPDCRMLMAACKKIATANPRIKGNISKRRTAISAFDWSIIDLNTDNEDIELKIALKSSITTLLRNHAKTPLYGSFAGLIEWAASGINKYTIANIKPFDPTELKPIDDSLHIVDDRNNIRDVIYIEDFKQADIIADIDTDQEERGGILRSILPLEKIRWDMRADNANTLGYLKGLLQIINKTGAEDEVAAASAHQTAMAAKKHKFIVTNEDIEFKLNQIVSGDLSGFKELITAINDETTISILGQANTTQLPNNGGSRAALQILKDISADIHYEDMLRTTDMINRFLRMFWVVNYNNYECPLEFRFNWFEEMNTVQNAETIATLIAAGIPLKRDEVYKSVGFTEPMQNEALLINNNSTTF